MKKHYLKYVKKAQMWCRTIIDEDKKPKERQKQEWSTNKPS